MTLTQLNYLIALNTYRHFGEAARHLYISQPTLSMQLQKLEEELELTIFDRSKKPVAPTPVGALVIEQAQEVIRAAEQLKETVAESKGKISGTFRLGIIPTVASTLLPRFVSKFTRAYPDVSLEVEEIQTEDLIHRLKKDQLDAGIAAIPLAEQGIKELSLYLEPFLAFIPEGHRLVKEKFVLQSELDIHDILLLDKGHCFRNNVINLCRQAGERKHSSLRLQSGNFETLVRLAKQGFGMTLLPYLYAMHLKPEEKKWLRSFDTPVPSRNIGLVYSRSQIRIRVIEAIRGSILQSLPKKLQEDASAKIISPVTR